MACGHTIHYGRRHELESNQVHQVNQVKPIAFVYDHAPVGTPVNTTTRACSVARAYLKKNESKTIVS